MMTIKRWISFLLGLVLLCGMLPMNVWAEQTETQETVFTTEEAAGTLVVEEPEAPSETPEAPEESETAESTGLTESDELVEVSEQDALETDGTVITRAQWLQLLVSTFGYTMDGEVVPDNYFPDLSPEAEYYEDVLIAVYYGLVDALPNENIYPDDAATREFAANTLNICMGYVPETESGYGFSEYATVTYPDDIQVAIERGWFALVNGAFLPQQPITANEQTAMLADTEEYLASMSIDIGHENTYTFKKDIIEITDAVQIDLDANGTVITIPNQDYSLKAGNKIVVYEDGLAIPYQVASVTSVGQQMQVRVTDLYFDDAIEAMDVQMETDTDPANFYAAEDAELLFIEEQTGQELTQQAAVYALSRGSKNLYIPKYTKTIEMGNATSFSLSVELKNTKLVYNVKRSGTALNASVYLDTDVEVSAKISCELDEISDDGIEVYIGGYEVPGVGGLAVYVKVDITGSISVVKKYHMRMGIKVGFDALKWKATKTRIFKITEKGSTINAEISAKIYLEAKFGLYGKALPVKGYLYGEAGFKASVKYTTYSDIEGNCVHFAAYLYAEYGAKVEWGAFGFKDSIDWNKEVIKEENSPVKISIHYEDGKQVSSCTRKDLDGTTTGKPSKIADSGYTTKHTSRYSGSGLSSGGSSTGFTSTGEPVIIYKYSLDDNNKATITSYSGNATSLTIPLRLDGYDVVAIGDNAFKDKTGIRTIIMQDNILTIGNSAFYGCTNLRNLILSEKLTSIGKSAFEKCQSLTTVDIPDQVVIIGERAFRECGKLSVVYFSKELTEIGTLAFQYCGSLKKVIFPNKLNTIGKEAFSNCTALTDVYIPISVQKGYVTYTHNDVFDDAYGIFDECINLTNIEYEEGTTSIHCGLFAGSGIKNVVLPETVTHIEPYAFAFCQQLETVTFPNSLTRIDEYAFWYCTALKKVDFPNKLSTIGKEAFSKCTALTDVYIPISVQKGAVTYTWNTTFDNAFGIFNGCTNLTNVKFEEGTSSIHDGLFAGSGIKNVVIPDTVTTIGPYAFAFCKQLKSIVLSNSLTSIGERCFWYCEGLTSISLPDSLTGIDGFAFARCTKLESVKMAPKLQKMGVKCFEFCTSLKEIFLPKTLTEIWWNTGDHCGPFSNCSSLEKAVFEEGSTFVGAHLANCTGLKTVVIPESVTSFGGYAFYKCSSLEGITISDSVTSMGEYVFYGCSSLTEVVVPDTVTNMGVYSFANCTSLKSVKLPNIRKNVMANMFESCTSLETITLPKTVTNIQDGAFKNCTSLKNIVWSDNLTNIGASAFYNCDGLTSITIPNGVTNVGSSCFQDCDALVSVNMPNSVTSMGSNVFYHCDLLKNVKLSRGLTVIPSGAFRECAALEQIVIPYFVTKIDGNAFNSSPKLKKVVTHPKLTTIVNSAFSYPTVTKFYGTTGSYTQTWCTDNGYSFNENTVTATKVTTASTLSLHKGKTAMLDITVEPADFCDTISFKSGNTAVVTVDETGKLTGVAPGTATIKVIVGGVSTSCKVTVTQAVTKITLDKSTLTLDVPKAYKLTATVTPANASNKKLTWTSSNKAVATVDQTGLITAVNNGTAVITATAADGSGISASCTVTVVDPSNILVSSIKLDKTSLSLEALETYQLTATVAPGNAANKTLIWSSSNEKVATVNAKGMVTAVSKGTATITAKAADKSGVSVTCSVTVVNNAYIVTNVSGLESSHNYPNNCNDVWVYSAAGAGELQVTFDSRTVMEDGFDFLFIYDAEGNLIGTYSGTELAGRTIKVPGNAVKIKLWSDGSSTEWGFKVTEIKEVKASALVKPNKIVNVVSGVHVYWNKIPGVAKYGLWRSETGKNGTYKWVANPTVPHFTDTKVQSGKTYYYKVTTMDANGKHSDKSDAIGITYVSTPDISARYNKAAGVKLDWKKVTGATGYAIYRKSYSGTDAWVRVATISGNATFTWTDTSVKNNNGTAYKYTIRALAGSNMKTLSGCRNAGRSMVRLTSRTLTGATKASATSIKCSWNTSSAVTGYEVRFMIGNTVYKTFTVGSYKTGVKTFTGLKAGQTYKIQVRSYKKIDGMGFYSAWSTAKEVKL